VDTYWNRLFARAILGPQRVDEKVDGIRTGYTHLSLAISGSGGFGPRKKVSAIIDPNNGRK